MNDDFESGAPHGLARIHDWLATRGRLIPLEAWPFILLAAVAGAANGRILLSSGLPDLLLLANAAAGALLPAAILIGCRGKWRSARLLLLGAIVWTSIPTLLDIVGWAQQLLSPVEWPDPSFVSGTQSARDLAAIISIAGPALIAIALEQRRRTETTWPKALVASSVIAAGALCLLAANAAIGVASGTTADFDSGYPWFVVVMALSPLRILTVGALAWSTMSAVRAREEPHRFWLSVSAGSALTLGVSILTIGLNIVSYSSFVYIAFPLIWLDIVGGLAGMAMLLVGFAQGLPDAASRAGGADEAVAVPSD
jgi:hypothetical protein